MNGQQQRQRHTAVQSLEQQITDLEFILAELDRRIVNVSTATKAALDHLDDRISRCVAQLQDQLASQIADRDQRIAAWEALTLWERLRWLLRGRT